MTLTLVLGSYSSVQASSILIPQAVAKTYYVSTTGNDANSGALTTPFKTISKAINAALTGDSIYVRAGTYPSFAVSKSGITIAAYSGEMPVISGGIGIRCYNANNVIIQGFEVTGASGNYIGAIMLDNCSNVTIQGNKVHDNTAATVTGITLSGSNNKILNNEVFNNNYSGIRLSGTSLNNEVAFNRVYNHTMSAGDSDGIDIAVSSVTKTNIHDNTVFGNSDDGIDTWVSPENIITNNITYSNGGTGDGNGIKLGGDTNGGNNTVTGNISYSNETCGFTSNGDGNYYESNTSYDNGTCGFDDNWRVAGNTQKSSFINNRAYNNPTGNFRTLAEYLTIFIGNLETAPGATPVAATSTAITVASPTFTATTAAPTIAATNTAVATPTASPMPIVPTATNSAAPTVTSQPTSIPATSIPVSNSDGLNIRVATGSDDVEESSSGVMFIDSSDLELIYDVNAQVIGIRFTGVAIPQGATITNAYIQFKVDETSSKAIKLTIKGEASANASVFTSAARNVSNRSKTAASVIWSPSAWSTVGDMGKAQQTPNLQAIVQEITNQPNWASGNALVMILTGNRGKRVASAFENDAAGAPLLHIEFSMPAQAMIAPLASTATAMPVPAEILSTPTATEMILPTETPIPTLFPSTPTSTPIPATP